MYIAHAPSDQRSREAPSYGLGIQTMPPPCPLTPCEDLMLKLCAARHQLRQVTAEKQRKEKELAGEQGRFDRLTCGRAQRTSGAKQACQILTNRIAALTDALSKLEAERLRLRGLFHSARDEYVRDCGALPAGFSSGKAVRIRKRGTGGFPCAWRQPC